MNWMNSFSELKQSRSLIKKCWILLVRSIHEDFAFGKRNSSSEMDIEDER